MQVVICLVIIALFFAVLTGRYVYLQSKRTDIQIEDRMTFDSVLDTVVHRVTDLLKDDGASAKDDTEFQTLYRRRMKIESALTDCIDGKEDAKIIVKEIIISILREMFPTSEDLHKVFPFDSFVLDPFWEWEMLLERLYHNYKKDTIKYLVHKYKWDKERYDIEDGTVPSYAVTTKDLHEAFVGEIIDRLSFREELSVAATLLYVRWKGMGVVDTLRTMNIDGFNIGTSGSIMETSNNTEEAQDWRAPRSVWMYFEGKYMHLRFLTFDSEAEMRRVVQLICRYNNPGSLTERRGYIVNTMEDKSRVLALRPPVCEYWACFVRKFTITSHTLEFLIDPIREDENGEEYHVFENIQLPLKTVKLLMRGQVTTAFTGRQGSGKTTMMTATISQVDARFNIRVLEMAPEMYLREIYPRRNILSVQETSTVSAAELQDALKKSDAALSIVGEVATDVIAARMLQMGQVASIFTIFSHHANRTTDLVDAITNSIVAASHGSATPATAMPQVIDVIKMDVHLDYGVDGVRYIERITEIVGLDKQQYPDQLEGEPLEAYKVRLQKEYYTRQTDRMMYTTNQILHLDMQHNRYVADNMFSEALTRHIINRLPKNEVQGWKDWLLENWGDSVS